MSDAIPGPLGATMLQDRACRFLTWAPFSSRVEVIILDEQGGSGQAMPMELLAHGYHQLVVPEIAAGTRYAFRLDGGEQLPDPASRFQPDGVHGPSAVTDPGFAWTDQAWKGRPLATYVIYELHVGTFTPEGTFDAVANRLDDVADLGVTAVELMPVCQFPGTRNWGYDGVFPWSVQGSYGGPDGLKRLVDACHARGLAAVLDVVHNHIGPEGNVLHRFGPYFTDRYRTPWGRAINFDGRGSDEVRRYFLESALRWFEEFHVDALRLDAIDGIVDTSPSPFLAELADRTHALAERLGRPLLLTPESDLGDPRVIRPRDEGGLGHDAQWADDFHHAIHALLTGERQGYFADFGRIEDVAKAYHDGYILTGQYSIYRDRRHGAPTEGIPAERFVVCAQNHDQVGNRPLGERLSCLVGLEQLKVAAGLVLCSPFVPLIFMGEEYGETAPFLYFISHLDPDLVEAVRQGRRRDHVRFEWKGEPADPSDERTFFRSKLDHDLQDRGHHRLLRGFYREMLRLRREIPALAQLSRDRLVAEPSEDGQGLFHVERWSDVNRVTVTFNLSSEQADGWTRDGTREQRVLIDSSDERWSGPGTLNPSVIEPGTENRFRHQPWSFIAVHQRGDEEAAA